MIGRRLALMVTLFGTAALLGCAAPGTPLMRAGVADGEGPLIEGCKNVSITARVNDYIAGYYLTTWGSAIQEGANQGMRQSLEEDPSLGIAGSMLQELVATLASPRAAGKLNSTSSRPEDWREKTNSLSTSPQPFCRRYAAKYDDVSRATAAIVMQMPHKPRVIDQRFGVFETEFVEGQHAAARWRDRYVVVVEPEGPDQTVMLVFRIVYIARSDNVFNQGISVGHNETWLMTQVADQLGR